jgi:hypothetical protein
VKAVFDSLQTTSKSPDFVPGVLLKAKKEALVQAKNQVNKGHTQGPWDQGHWANRR